MEELRMIFGRYRIDQVLNGLCRFRSQFLPFQIASAACITMEYSILGAFSDNVKNISKVEIELLCNVATQYVLRKSEEKLGGGSEIFFHLFKLHANQSSVSCEMYGEYARAIAMYDEIASGLEFDSQQSGIPFLFERDKGYSISEYLTVCTICNSAAESHSLFTDQYFINGSEVLDLPNKKTINRILNDISATPLKLINTSFDINNGAYYNVLPITLFPLLKPWSTRRKKGYAKRYVVPLPHLIGQKCHMNIYYYFLNKYGRTFTSFFGKRIFEEYVGRVLNESICGQYLFNEDKLKELIHNRKGVKIPDWAIEEDKKLIMIECKAARLPLKALTRGNIQDFKSAFEHIKKGVFQIGEYIECCKKMNPKKFKDFFGVIVTYEPLFGLDSNKFLTDFISEHYLAKSEFEPFKKYLRNIIVISVGKLEVLQVHFKAGVPIFKTLKTLQDDMFNDIVDKMVSRTGKTFGDSMFWKYHKDIYDLIGFVKE